MEKIQISDVFSCNRVLFALMQQQSKFPISVGLKLFKISKIFDEVEEYVFNVMNMTFNDYSFENMTDEQNLFFNKLMNENIELDYEKIPVSVFENNEEIKLTIEEISYLSIILQEKSQ